MVDLVVIVAVARLLISGLINASALYVAILKKQTEVLPGGKVHKLIRLEKAVDTALHISAILYLVELFVGEYA